MYGAELPLENAELLSFKPGICSLSGNPDPVPRISRNSQNNWNWFYQVALHVVEDVQSDFVHRSFSHQIEIQMQIDVKFLY